MQRRLYVFIIKSKRSGIGTGVGQRLLPPPGGGLLGGGEGVHIVVSRRFHFLMFLIILTI